MGTAHLHMLEVRDRKWRTVEFGSFYFKNINHPMYCRLALHSLHGRDDGELLILLPVPKWLGPKLGSLQEAELTLH